MVDNTNINDRRLDVVLDLRTRASFMNQPIIGSISRLPRWRASNGCGSDMTVAFVIRLTNSRPNTAHQFIVVTLAVMESAVSLPEGVGFFSGGDQVALGRKT